MIRVLILLAATSICAAQTTRPTTYPSDWVAVQIDLPRPPFISWQGSIPPDAERPGPKPRPPLMAPPGTVLLSRGRPVTSSDREPVIGALKQVTDGDKSYEEGSIVELARGPQWVQIDLAAQCELRAILVWRCHNIPRVYKDLAVQVSNDSTFTEGVPTLFNNDADNALGLGKGTDRRYVEFHEGRLIEARGLSVRYVRLWSSSGTPEDEGSQWVEAEVFGRRPAVAP